MADSGLFFPGAGPALFHLLLIFVQNDEKVAKKLGFPLDNCALFLYNGCKYCDWRRGTLGEVITIASGKGGTGKTSLCAGIASALSELNCSVLCVDCDVGLRNLDISLGISDGALSFLDVCRGDYSLEQAAVHPDYPKLRFLTAPISCGPEDIDADAFREMVRTAKNQFDYVLLDAPAGVDAGLKLTAAVADRILLVTGADPAAVRDAARTGQVLELMGKDKVRLIINRVRRKLLGSMDINLDDVMDEAGLPLIGVVPEDTNVTLSASKRKPMLLFRRTPAAAACRRIAKRIQGMPVALPKK